MISVFPNHRDTFAPCLRNRSAGHYEQETRPIVQRPIESELVNLRYFAGVTKEEAAQVLGISLSTVNYYWNFSRAWLLNQIQRQ